jgi:putative NADH-flavin reductase
MDVLVVGATGATGHLLVGQLLDRGHDVRAVVRSPDRLPEALRDHERLSLTEASLLDLTDAELAQLVDGCDAVASCLGHNLDAKGMFGKPRRLVTDAARRLCGAIRANGADRPTKYVLMNTAGNTNRDLDEPASFAQRSVVGVLRVVLPPQADNEQAAEYLRAVVGQDDAAVEWVAVRPDSLIDEDRVTDYEIHPSPIRDPIFDAGETSRINVAHFMAELITDDEMWNAWKGQMPVIYNKE